MAERRQWPRAAVEVFSVCDGETIEALLAIVAAENDKARTDLVGESQGMDAILRLQGRVRAYESLAVLMREAWMGIQRAASSQKE